MLNFLELLKHFRVQRLFRDTQIVIFTPLVIVRRNIDDRHASVLQYGGLEALVHSDSDRDHYDDRYSTDNNAYYCKDRSCFTTEEVSQTHSNKVNNPHRRYPLLYSFSS